MKIEVKKLTPQQCAEAFCELNSKEQAEFFIEAARIGDTWEQTATCFQWGDVGKYLQHREIGTAEAALMITEIARGARILPPWMSVDGLDK